MSKGEFSSSILSSQDIVFLLSLLSNWDLGSSWISSLPAFGLQLLHWLSWVSSLQTRLQDLLAFIIVWANSLSFYLWRTPTNPIMPIVIFFQGWWGHYLLKKHIFFFFVNCWNHWLFKKSLILFLCYMFLQCRILSYILEQCKNKWFLAIY